jgi:hypothetical protein
MKQELEGSTSLTSELITAPSPETVQSSAHPYNLLYILILSFRLLLGFPRDFSANILYIFIVSPSQLHVQYAVTSLI